MSAAAPVAAGCRSASTIAMSTVGSNELFPVGQAQGEVLVVAISVVLSLCIKYHCCVRDSDYESTVAITMFNVTTDLKSHDVHDGGKCGDALFAPRLSGSVCTLEAFPPEALAQGLSSPFCSR